MYNLLHNLNTPVGLYGSTGYSDIPHTQVQVQHAYISTLTGTARTHHDTHSQVQHAHITTLTHTHRCRCSTHTSPHTFSGAALINHTPHQTHTNTQLQHAHLTTHTPHHKHTPHTHAHHTPTRTHTHFTGMCNLLPNLHNPLSLCVELWQ